MTAQAECHNQDIEVLIEQTVEDLALTNDNAKSVNKQQSKASTIIKVFFSFQQDQAEIDMNEMFDQDIRGALPCLLTLVVLLVIVMTVFPYVFSYVIRLSVLSIMSTRRNSRLTERAASLESWRRGSVSANLTVTPAGPETVPLASPTDPDI